ncbi:hypothetical protein [Salmonella enterica]
MELPPAVPWLNFAGISTGRPANIAFPAPLAYSNPSGNGYQR